MLTIPVSIPGLGVSASCPHPTCTPLISLPASLPHTSHLTSNYHITTMSTTVIREVVPGITIFSTCVSTHA